MQAPDDWNSGKLSATFLNLDWKLNGIFATNFATKLFASSDESIAFFAIVNAPSMFSTGHCQDNYMGVTMLGMGKLH
jgi:hypothetical protein